jgi:hypothetical protein
MKRTLILIGLFLLAGLALAQDSVKIERTFQFSFIYPLSTSGVDAHKYSNLVSFNLLGGVNGGVRAFEAGGLFNWNSGTVTGGQLAGFVNVNTNAARGFQASGLGNWNGGSMTGAQGSGFLNVNTGHMKGAQFAGMVNYNGGGTTGATGSGLANLILGDIRGFQGAGLTNVTIGDLNGVAASGIANYSHGTTNGVQISGFYNHTRVLNGVQIGLFNYVDSLKKGVPIGFLSFVRKNGYRRVEFESNETFYGNISFKTGTQRFYNILSIGGTPRGMGYWGFGYGVGTAVNFSDKLGMNVDLVTTQVIEGSRWQNDMNLMNRLKVNAHYRFKNGIEVFGGPTYVISASTLTDGEGNIVGGSFEPDNTFYDKLVGDETRVRMYIGFNAGVRL